MSRISSPGRYSGYSEPVADGYQRQSRYLSMDDGCRIAIDVLRPARGDSLLEGPLPTVVQATGYRRAYIFSESDQRIAGNTASWRPLEIGELVTGYEKSWVGRQFVDYGYNMVCLDMRGTGASFGAEMGRTWRNAADIARIIDWIPTQDWATDKVGMFGSSWEATIQLHVAAYQPRHLTAIIPASTSTGFSAICDNGLMLHGFFYVDWANLVREQADQSPALPVDEDLDGELFAQAQAQRVVGQLDAPTSDDPLAAMKLSTEAIIPATREGAPPPPQPELGELGDGMDEVRRINACGSAIMLISGWWDLTFNGHVLDFYRALDCPKRLLMGPWHHLGTFCTHVEQLRWFDYWLKGIDNGIVDEDPFVWGTTDAEQQTRWASAPGYPLPESRKQLLHLRADGGLASAPSAAEALDYQVDYEVTLGTNSRSRHFFRDEKQIIPPNLDERARRCLCFESPVFECGLEINGRPELYLYLATSGRSGAVFATLEEIRADGSAVYFGEGNLNFFHRRISNPPRPHDGRAFHSQRATDLLEVEPGAEMKLGLEFYPVAWRLTAGSRIRLTLAGADADNFLVIPETPAPNWSLRVGGEPASRLYLPAIDPDLPATRRETEATFEGLFSHAFV